MSEEPPWELTVVVEAVRARPRLTVVLAVLAICAGLLLTSAGESIAAIRIGTYNFSRSDSTGSYYIDSDRSVPEYQAYVPDTDVMIIGVTRYNVTAYGRDYDARVYIHYDINQMRNHCAAQDDYNDMYRHERAHSRGWRHNEGRPSTNGAYYPSIGKLPC